jgi:hypothetical protein
VRAVLAGERDPQALAALRHPGIHASWDTIAKSLESSGGPTSCSLHQEVTMYDAYLQRIDECDQALAQHLKSFADKGGDPAVSRERVLGSAREPRH